MFWDTLVAAQLLTLRLNDFSNKMLLNFHTKITEHCSHFQANYQIFASK